MKGKLTRGVAFVNERIGWGGGALIVAIMCLGVFEVMMRYLFGNPTKWAWEINQQMMVMLVALAGGYALLHRAFVRVDVFYARFSPRTKVICDVVMFVFIVLFCVTLMWKGWQVGWHSLQMREATASWFAPPIYHLRLMIPVGAFLVMLQAMSNLISDIIILNRGTKGS